MKAAQFFDRKDIRVVDIDEPQISEKCRLRLL